MIEPGELVLIWSPYKGDSYMLKVSPGSVQGTHLGQIKHEDMAASEYGGVVLTNKGEPFFILRPTIGEYTRRIKRHTQVIFPKDAGYIIQHLNFGPGATVVECGTGSGGLACTFAHFVGDNGRVVSYDRREEFSRLAESNAERWGVRHRVEFKTRDLREGFDERDVDAVYLDVQNPWDYIGVAHEALAFGNRLGILVPTFNQIEKTLDTLRTYHFVDVQVLEILLRFLKTDPRRIRPEDTMIGHTGYLIFAAKAAPYEKPEAESEESRPEETPADE